MGCGFDDCCTSCRYLGGVLDFTGELNRYAIARATVRDAVEVQRCRDLVDTLLGLFLQVGDSDLCIGWVHYKGAACLYAHDGLPRSSLCCQGVGSFHVTISLVPQQLHLSMEALTYAP